MEALQAADNSDSFPALRSGRRSAALLLGVRDGLLPVPPVERDTVHGSEGRILLTAGEKPELVAALCVDTDSICGIAARVRAIRPTGSDTASWVNGDVVLVVTFAHILLLTAHMKNRWDQRT